MNDLSRDLIEQLAFEARNSEFVDQKSGVSARMTITAMENLISNAERRALKNKDAQTYIRVSDFWGVIPSITGKIELVYEGEQEGPFIVAVNLIGKAIRTQFTNYFPAPEKSKKIPLKKTENPTATKRVNIYQEIVDYFNEGNKLDLFNDLNNEAYHSALLSIPGLKRLVEKYFLMEFVLHGLAEYSLLSKHILQSGVQFSDLFSSMFTNNEFDGLEEEDDFKI